MGGTVEQGILEGIARREDPAAIVHRGDVAAWMASEGLDPGRLEQEARDLRRTTPNPLAETAATIVAVAAGFAFAMFAINLVGGGGARGTVDLGLGLVAAGTTFGAAAFVAARLNGEARRVGLRLAEVGAKLERRSRMAREVFEVDDDGVVIRSLEDGLTGTSLIPAGTVASVDLEVMPGGRHVSVTLTSLDGTTTWFPWIARVPGSVTGRNVELAFERLGRAKAETEVATA